jgi:hypothetical protein
MRTDTRQFPIAFISYQERIINLCNLCNTDPFPVGVLPLSMLQMRLHAQTHRLLLLWISSASVKINHLPSPDTSNSRSNKRCLHFPYTKWWKVYSTYKVELVKTSRHWSAALDMEAVCSSETLVSTYKSTRRYNPHRHLHRRENLKTHMVKKVYKYGMTLFTWREYIKKIKDKMESTSIPIPWIQEEENPSSINFNL